MARPKWLEASGVAYSRIPIAYHLLQQYGLWADSGSKKSTRALMALLEQPWFQRVWIVQEVVVSKLVRVVQGNFEVLWEDFAAAVVLVWELRLEIFTSSRGQRNQKNVHFIEGFRRLRRDGKTGQLKRLASLLRDAKSTDPRDKLYALIGISNDFSVANQSMLSYDRPVSDAFRL
jgi:hypothetical protein